MGYYRGKAAQEARYQNAKIPTTIVRSTQWFELAETLVEQMKDSGRWRWCRICTASRSLPMRWRGWFVSMVEAGNGCPGRG